MRNKTNLKVKNNVDITVSPYMIVGDSKEYRSGDILDANATSELIDNSMRTSTFLKQILQQSSGSDRVYIKEYVQKINGVTKNALTQQILNESLQGRDISNSGVVFVVQHDFSLGTPINKQLTFSSENVTSVKTKEKKSLEKRISDYNTAVEAYNEALADHNTANTEYNEAAAAYEADDSSENLEILEAADTALLVANAALRQAEKAKNKAESKMNSDMASYSESGSQDYYYYTTINIEPFHALHLSGRAILLNDTKTAQVEIDRNIILGGSTGKTVCIGCIGGAYSYRYDRYISIPNNSILQFDGGSISNGTVVGNNTQIVALKKPIFTDVKVVGNWLVPDITTKWFSDINNNNVLREAFALQNDNILNTIVIEQGEYAVSVDVGGESVLSCSSNLNLVINGNVNLAPNSFDYYYILECRAKHHINISGSGSIIGDKLTHTGITGEWGMGISISGSSFVTIKDLKIKDCWGDCIYISGNGASNLIIDNCDIDNGRRQGISITNGDNIVIRNCKIQNVGGTNPQAAIDIETNIGKHASTIIICNNFVYNCTLGIVIYGRSSYTKNSITIENNYISCVWRAIAANGISTCVKVSNNEIHTMYNSIDANTIDGTQDNMILFENNMIYQTAIATESPYNNPTRLCCIYALKGDYFFKHNQISSAMPVFRFAGGNKYIEDNNIVCPTLFSQKKGCRNVKIINNNITGNVSMPGQSCRFENNIVTGYLRSVRDNVKDDGCIISGNVINHPANESDITTAWNATLQPEEALPTGNATCNLLGKNLVISNNTFTNVTLDVKYGVIERNFIKYDKNFTPVPYLLKIGSCDLLYNTITYQAINANDINVYVVEKGRRMIGNNIASSSRIQYVFYHNSGTFISHNSITLPEGHASGRIIQQKNCTVQLMEVTTGTTEERPVFPEGDKYYIGHQYFDTTLSKSVTWNGQAWVDQQ